MSTPYLFDNAVLDRHARIANRIPVDGELVFAERLWLLASVPAVDEDVDDELLDTFLDRKRLYTKGETGGVRLGLMLIVTLLGAGAWGWFHGSSAPNGATLLGILLFAVTVSIIATFGHFYRRAERRGAAYTARIEKRLRQDTTGDHIWDA